MFEGNETMRQGGYGQRGCNRYAKTKLFNAVAEWEVYVMKKKDLSSHHGYPLLHSKKNILQLFILRRL